MVMMQAIVTTATNPTEGFQVLLPGELHRLCFISY